MNEMWDEFSQIVTALLNRYARQNAHAVPTTATVQRFVVQLRGMIEQRGLPRPLSPAEVGAPGGMNEAELAPLLTQVIEGVSEPWLADLARQCVKACLYPEFKVCRDSYREVGRDGACRRQELERARARISGAHCVDCPHWVDLAPEEHAALLAREWRGDGRSFATERGVFLPEDFREFRCWLHAVARSGMVRVQ